MPAKIRVLLIEDDLEDAELIQRSFLRVSEEMFDVHHVGRFRDAIQIIKTNSFNVVILDLGLPDSIGLNGVERLMSLIPQVPVIVLTGLDDEDEATRGIELGAQEFLQKGDIGSKQLVTKIRHAIKRMQYTNHLIGQGADAIQSKRLDDLADSVRQATTEIGASVESLGVTDLTEDQLTIVEEIKRSSLESLNAVDRLVPNSIEFIESASDSNVDSDETPTS
jgi:DNA-binding response OmpR family regulator